MAIFRLIFALMQQAWFARVATVVAILLLAAATAGWRLHWSSYPSFIEWGIFWTTFAVGSWVLNRNASA